MDNVAQKLFALYIRSDTSEGMVALKKLAALGVMLDDVAVSIGDGKWKTRYGNIEFQLDARSAIKNMVTHPSYVHHGLGCENPDYSSWCTKNAATCEMIVLATGTTLSRMKYCQGQRCRHPVGTCMIMPPDRCWYA